ncbi:hypothetical protein KSP40_PGU010357 [Platanthera guangdongensis]|uniref:Uncharacterized protein n=1 Tax=Platanthera guangdongensis TaxID=2320717 RepID=A0ABR2LN39_9ASPA
MFLRGNKSKEAEQIQTCYGHHLTSDHYHPWTHKENALAGSTRTQPSKVNTSSSSTHPDDFFADLAELDPDPMNIVFPKGFVGDKMDHERKNGSSDSSKKAMNPFDMFDWEERDAFGEERRGL